MQGLGRLMGCGLVCGVANALATVVGLDTVAGVATTAGAADTGGLGGGSDAALAALVASWGSRVTSDVGSLSQAEALTKAKQNSAPSTNPRSIVTANIISRARMRNWSP